MVAVTDIKGAGSLWSISQLAREFGMARETVSKRLADVDVRPESKRAGHPVYRLRDACPALFGFAAARDGGEVDPERLTPADRDRWYAGEQKRLDVLKEKGQLMDADDVRQVWSTTLKAIMLSLETLTDVIERDAGLSPEQVKAVQRVVDSQRASMYQDIIGATE